MCGPDRDPFPHREWGRFPASWGRFGNKEILESRSGNEHAWGNCLRELPTQDPTDFGSIPPGSGLKPSAFGSKAPYRVVV